MAEESGLIAPLGWLSLEQACQAAAEWMLRGFDTGVSVNVGIFGTDRGELDCADLPYRIVGG